MIYHGLRPNGWDDNVFKGVTRMDTMKWEKLMEVQGRLEAELIESFLEANGVDVELFQESIGHSAYPVMIDGLGRVQIFVSKNQIQEARELIKDFNEGVSQEE
jgi:hypothetical protein